MARTEDLARCASRLSARRVRRASAEAA
jgi:hypothetical protein